MLSLLVAVTLIPALSNGLLGGVKSENSGFRVPLLDDFASWFTRFWTGYARFVVRQKFFAVALVALIVTVAGTISILIMPKLDYLPKGNRNLVFGIVLPPAGYNLDTNEDLAWAEDNLDHKWNWVESKVKPPPKDYYVPDFGLDEDIKTTQFNTRAAEKTYGAWNVE